MFELLLVSLIWGFSFGLIKNLLAGVDPIFISFARLSISLLVFIPFFRLHGVDRKLGLRLVLIGAIQYGLMYITYNYSFQFLKAYEVALFTIFTPLYVSIIDDLFQKRFNALGFLTTILAVIGTAFVEKTNLERSDIWLGFLVVQVSNLCFAFGQVYYKRLMAKTTGLKDQNLFGIVYIGAALITGVSAAFFTNWSEVKLTTQQILGLIYLGAIASGLCFFLWNHGARKVNTGALAIFNNLKIPLAIAVSTLFFGETANIPRLLIGGSIVISALIINEVGIRSRRIKQQNSPSTS